MPLLVELAPRFGKSGIMAWQVALEGVSSIVVASISGVSWPTQGVRSQKANKIASKVEWYLFFPDLYDRGVMHLLKGWRGLA